MDKKELTTKYVVLIEGEGIEGVKCVKVLVPEDVGVLATIKEQFPGVKVIDLMPD